jgi:hypothetical protein
MFRQLALAATAAFALTAAAEAAIPVYSNPGVEAPAVASYTAPFAGTVTAWFLARDAAFNSEIGLGINGAAPVFFTLPNTSAPGTSAVLGTVNAGDVMRFYLRVINTGDIFSTDPGENTDGFNHAWHTAYAGGDFGVPAGLLIGWEDIRGGGDRDYNDHVFSFRFPGSPGIPEPATWALMIAGFGLVGIAARRRRVAHVSA